MASKSQGIGYRFEKLVLGLFEDAEIPCVRPRGSSGESLRAVGLTPTGAAEIYSDEIDLVTDFREVTEAVWQLKALKTIPRWVYDAPFDPVGNVLTEIYAEMGRPLGEPEATVIDGQKYLVGRPIYGGLLVHDGTAHDDHVVLRWPAFVQWLRLYRTRMELTSEEYYDVRLGVPMPRLQSLCLDRVMAELKPRGDRLGRIVRRNEAQRNARGHHLPPPHYPVAVLRERDFYGPYLLDL